jgi:putative endonuclease
MRVKEALAEATGKTAASYLEGIGFRVLDRDWRCEDEIASVIAADCRALVVIDLRVRAGTRHGTPLGAVAAGRQQAMRRLAARWMASHGILRCPELPGQSSVRMIPGR